ncbi:MAG: hypothetical protein A2428_17880 [Bdellovibrionales bacterium RIFOXYC1_FULL_54_43]|nr:MAG: hypothetical protein A2428_17880 [Bdellovibrionales bacterium RIFOXYC1_FULL_54_43]OFZ79691.1 MAG: hypothetical protein A2603_06070 [Bdellovibrionales bacterium RIFOXYD1_FULL_55_31]
MHSQECYSSAPIAHTPEVFPSVCSVLKEYLMEAQNQTEFEVIDLDSIEATTVISSSTVGTF